MSVGIVIDDIVYNKMRGVIKMNIGLDSLGCLGLEAVDVEESAVKEEVTISKVTYQSLIDKLSNFISLDISVTNTGWVKKVDGVITHGAYPLEATDDLGRRQEFRRFLRDLAGDAEYEYIFIEDVIGSCNFKTAKSLMKLNPIADDMVYDGVIKAKKIIRIDNKEWKKHLKKVSGYKSQIASEKDKALIVGALRMLDFPYALSSEDSENGIAQDIFDAYGIACGVSYKLNSVKDSGKSNSKSYDITKKHMLKQYDSKEKAMKYITKFQKDKKVSEYSFLGKARDIKANFKAIVKEEEANGVETDVYLIEIATDKIGVVALDKKFNLDYPISYVVVVKK